MSDNSKYEFYAAIHDECEDSPCGNCCVVEISDGALALAERIAPLERMSPDAWIHKALSEQLERDGFK